MKPFNSFLFRTPLLPYNTNVQNPFELFKHDPRIREAIFICSQSLFEKTYEILNGKITDSAEKERVELSLLKYFKRLSYRCTPFGINAGISIGELWNVNKMQLRPSDNYRKHVRLDMAFLGKIHQEILRNFSLARRLRFFPNNTIYEFNEQFRYYEYQYTPQRKYALSAVVQDQVVSEILNFADGGILLDDLAQKLSTDYSFEDVETYLTELISNKILISELEPTISGEFSGDTIRKFIEDNFDPKYSWTVVLKDLFAKLDELTAKEIGAGTEAYVSLKAIANETGFNEKDAIQVDMFKPVDAASLDRSLLTPLKEACEIAYGLSRHREFKTSKQLNAFIKEFDKRYEGMEIPLTLALDPDAGIGYPCMAEVESEDHLTSELTYGKSKKIDFEFDPSFEAILEKYYDCIANNALEIELGEQDYIHLGAKDAFRGSVVSSLFSVIKENDCTKILHMGSEDMGISLGARFSHLDERIFNSIKSICAAEEEFFEAHGIMIAEIVFLPEDKSGNIMFKPHLRNCEISIVSKSSLTPSETIPLNDIMISIAHGRIVLRSKKLKAFIIPKFSAVYNLSLCDVPIFKFFCDLKYQFSYGTLNWLWSILTYMPFQPRVRYKNVILSRATWYVLLKNVKPFLESRNTESIINYFTSRNMPLQFCLSQDDSLLPISLTEEKDRKLFIKELKKFNNLAIVEDVYRNSDLIVQGDGQGFTNECVVFWNNLDAQVPSLYKGNPLNFQSKKVFLPGEDWVFYKIFCGQRVADYLIRKYLRNLMDSLKSSGTISQWFFIRYSDPDFHIRLRVLASNENNSVAQKGINTVLQTLYHSRLIWKYQLDVYNRELQRYGDLNIQNSEALFGIDSECVFNIISEIKETDLSEIRWKIALAGTDSLLADFGFDIQERIGLTTKIKSVMFSEFGFNGDTKAGLRNKYRKYRDEIKKILSRESTELGQVFSAFDRRSEQLKPVVREIRKLSQESELSMSYDDTVISYIHMFLNRLFISKHRIQETVIYDLLNQHYKSANSMDLHVRGNALSRQDK